MTQNWALLTPPLSRAAGLYSQSLKKRNSTEHLTAMMLHSVLLAGGLAAASASVTSCWKDGQTAPCGPGNDQCGVPLVAARPR
jgi:hypothetical protein